MGSNTALKLAVKMRQGISKLVMCGEPGTTDQMDGDFLDTKSDAIVIRQY